jgi:hypothetical protein
MLIGLAKTIGEGCLGFVKVHNVKEFIEYAKNTRLLHNEQKTWGDLDIAKFSFVQSLEWGIWDSHGQLWAGGRDRKSIY